VALHHTGHAMLMLDARPGKSDHLPGH